MINALAGKCGYFITRRLNEALYLSRLMAMCCT
jgi:hypothetical protein